MINLFLFFNLFRSCATRWIAEKGNRVSSCGILCVKRENCVWKIEKELGVGIKHSPSR